MGITCSYLTVSAMNKKLGFLLLCSTPGNLDGFLLGWMSTACTLVSRSFDSPTIFPAISRGYVLIFPLCHLDFSLL